MGFVRPTVQEWCIPVQYTSSPEIIKNCLQEVLENHPRKMRPIAKRKFEDLEKAILDYYEEQEIPTFT